MALSEEEKGRARHHMGYMEVSAAQAFALGVPAAVPTNFMAEGAFNRINPSAEARFRRYLDEADKVECQVSENTELLATAEMGEVKLRENELALLAQRYKVWQQSIANMLGVVPNPYDQRDWLKSAVGMTNVPVSG